MIIHMLQSNSKAYGFILIQLINHIVVIKNTDGTTVLKIKIRAKPAKNRFSSPYVRFATLINMTGRPLRWRGNTKGYGGDKNVFANACQCMQLMHEERRLCWPCMVDPNYLRRITCVSTHIWNRALWTHKVYIKDWGQSSKTTSCIKEEKLQRKLTSMCFIGTRC